MTRGGVTPPIPPGTTAAQVFTDAACTTRPVEGDVYETLYVRLNRSYGYGDYIDYNDGPSPYNKLTVVTPDNDDPEALYSITLWGNGSNDYDNPFTAGTVIAVNTTGSGPLPSSITIDFYDV